MTIDGTRKIRAERLYRRTRLPVIAIERETGITRRTIHGWAKANGWSRPKRYSRNSRAGLRELDDLSAAEIEDFRKIWCDGNVHVETIAKQFRFPWGSVARYAELLGFPPRDNWRKYSHVRGADMPAGPARSCQFPLWDKELPTIDHLDDYFCGAPVQAGSSYCPAHHARCYRKAEDFEEETG